MSVDAKFRQAKENVGKLSQSQEPGNDVKLKIYALFKQVRLAVCRQRPKGSLQSLRILRNWENSY